MHCIRIINVSNIIIIIIIIILILIIIIIIIIIITIITITVITIIIIIIIIITVITIIIITIIITIFIITIPFPCARYALRAGLDDPDFGHVVLSVDFLLFFLRLLRVLTLSRTIGPMLPMIWNMVSPSGPCCP